MTWEIIQRKVAARKLPAWPPRTHVRGAIGRVVMKNIRQNLFFAFIYNALGVPIGGGILDPLFHVLLNPMIAAAAMSCSSVSVISNALRLRNIPLE